MLTLWILALSPIIGAPTPSWQTQCHQNLQILKQYVQTLYESTPQRVSSLAPDNAPGTDIFTPIGKHWHTVINGTTQQVCALVQHIVHTAQQYPSRDSLLTALLMGSRWMYLVNLPDNILADSSLPKEVAAPGYSLIRYLYIQTAMRLYAPTIPVFRACRPLQNAPYYQWLYCALRQIPYTIDWLFDSLSTYKREIAGILYYDIQHRQIAFHPIYDERGKIMKQGLQELAQLRKQCIQKPSSICWHKFDKQAKKFLDQINIDEYYNELQEIHRYIVDSILAQKKTHSFTNNPQYLILYQELAQLTQPFAELTPIELLRRWPYISARSRSLFIQWTALRSVMFPSDSFRLLPHPRRPIPAIPIPASTAGMAATPPEKLRLRPHVLHKSPRQETLHTDPLHGPHHQAFPKHFPPPPLLRRPLLPLPSQFTASIQATRTSHYTQCPPITRHGHRLSSANTQARILL